MADVDDKTGISADDLAGIVGNYDALIVRGRTKVTAAILAAGTNLKVVGRAGVGVDNIDLNAAKEKNIVVVNSPLATTVAVAELTLGLMLSLVRDLPRADKSMKDGKWLKKEFEGAELFGKTLGVIGMGRIGAAVVKRAAAFDMNVVGYDPLIPADEIQKRGAQPVTLDELYAKADVITMHIPLTADSKHLINAAAIATMKQGVHIVCAARGGVIDEAALLDGLNSGKVAGAALDVFSTEPPGLTDLVAHPKVVCAPHVGAQTVEAQARAAEDIASEITRALQGEMLRWRVA
jgi:D-3-phosphoglycerate dehydrogenase